MHTTQRLQRTRRLTYSTGEVAKLCEVAPRTVTKWTDSGRLPCYRLPESRDRRIKHDDLVAYMRQHNLPLDALGVSSLTMQPAVVVATCDHLLVGSLDGKVLGVQLRFAASLFGAGRHVAGAAVVVLDFALGRHDCIVAAGWGFKDVSPRPALIAIACEDESEPADFASKFDAVFKRPFDPAALVERLAAVGE